MVSGQHGPYLLHAWRLADGRRTRSVFLTQWTGAASCQVSSSKTKEERAPPHPMKLKDFITMYMHIYYVKNILFISHMVVVRIYLHSVDVNSDGCLPQLSYLYTNHRAITRHLISKKNGIIRENNCMSMIRI